MELLLLGSCGAYQQFKHEQLRLQQLMYGVSGGRQCVSAGVSSRIRRTASPSLTSMITSCRWSLRQALGASLVLHQSRSAPAQLTGRGAQKQPH